MKFKVVLASVLLAISLILTGCGTSNNTEDIGTWSITVEVAGESPIEFTNEDAQKIGSVEFTAAVKDGDSFKEANTWTGILLYDFLDYIGVKEFSVISVEAVDGYSVELDPSRIVEEGTGFGWAVNGEMLDEESGPIELVNHERGSKHWVKQVSRVTVIK